MDLRTKLTGIQHVGIPTDDIQKSILFYKGLDIVADIMGLELKEKFVQDELPNQSYYRYSFVYDGVEFVTYSEERMSRFAKSD